MDIKNYPLYFGGVKQYWAKAVVAGDFVFLSGVSGREFETGKVKALDVSVQTEVAWSKIKSILAEVGTSLDRIVKIIICLRNVKDFDGYHAATRKFLKNECPYLLDNPPATTFVEAGLSHKEMLVEIDITAVLPKQFF